MTDYTLGSITPPSGIDSLGGCSGCGLWWDDQYLQGLPLSGTRKWTDLEGAVTATGTTTFTAAGATIAYAGKGVQDNENLYEVSFRVSGVTRPYFAAATNGLDFVGGSPLANEAGTLLQNYVRRSFWSARSGGRALGQYWSTTTAVTKTLYLWGSSYSGTALATFTDTSFYLAGHWMRPDTSGEIYVYSQTNSTGSTGTLRRLNADTLAVEETWSYSGGGIADGWRPLWVSPDKSLAVWGKRVFTLSGGVATLVQTKAVSTSLFGGPVGNSLLYGGFYLGLDQQSACNVEEAEMAGVRGDAVGAFAVGNYRASLDGHGSVAAGNVRGANYHAALAGVHRAVGAVNVRSYYLEIAVASPATGAISVANYYATVSARHSARATLQIDQLYPVWAGWGLGGRAVVAAGWPCPSPALGLVVAGWPCPVPLRATGDVVQGWRCPSPPVVSAGWRCPVHLLGAVVAGWPVPVALAAPPEPVLAGWSCPVHLLGAVAAGWSLPTQIGGQSKVAAGWPVPVRLRAPRQPGDGMFQQVPVWRWRGDVIDAAGEIRAETGGNWGCSLSVGNLVTAARMRINDPVTCSIGGITWSFVVDSVSRSGSGATSRSREFGLVGARLAGLEFPRVEPVSQVWETAVTARDVCEALAGGAIEWRILDWPIPPFALASSGESPLAVIKRVVGAVKAVFEARPDGALVARYESPVAVPRLAAVPPDLTLSEAAQVYSIQTSLEFGRGYGAVEVSDSDASPSDQLEWVASEEDSLLGEVWAYPSPDRPVSLRCTHHLVSYGGGNRSLREVEERLEFRQGVATTRYPIALLQSVDWESTAIGGVSHKRGGRDLRATTLRESLATVRYLTAGYVWAVSGVDSITAQFVLEDHKWVG